MIHALKTFIDSLSGAETAPRLAETDHRLAAAALLVHVMAVDGQTTEAERRRLCAVLRREFDLDEREAEELIEAGRERDVEAVDLYGFTSVLKRSLDESERQRVIGMMWEMVFADGEVSEFEDNLVWRVAELLGVSTRDRVLLRKQIEARGGAA